VTRRRHRVLALALAILAGIVAGVLPGAARLRAQSTLDSPPNLSNWVAVPGGLQFNLLHRFSIGPAPSRKLQNAPTANILYGITPWLSAGLNYASASEVVQGYPNEWELLSRVALLSQDDGAPVDVHAQGGWNVATESVDGQLLVSRRVGAVRAVAGVGALQHAPGTGTRRATVATGATVRVRGLVGLTADASTFANREEADVVAWSAGVNVGIAGTPHTMSLHATNVASRTLQGIAHGTSDTRYGFEYTIPISIGRGRAIALAPVDSPPVLPRAGDAPRTNPDDRQAKPVVIDIRSLRYSKQKIVVDAGTTVVWRNRDPLPHTVTSDSGSFDSGEIKSDASWTRTFTEPGTYSYHCAPHPHMTAVIVVRARP
jgi:plastocyanin